MIFGYPGPMIRVALTLKASEVDPSTTIVIAKIINISHHIHIVMRKIYRPS